MRVLQLTGTRTFDVVLRDYAIGTDTYDVNLFNENTGATSVVSVTKTVAEIQTNLDQLQVTITSTFNEGDEYSFYITGNAETVVLHRNKLFFTDKVPQNYTVNE